MQETWDWVCNPWVRKVPWRRKWQHTPVFLPRKSHGQRNLVGYSPWDCKGVGHNWAAKQQPHAPLDAMHREGDTIMSVQRSSQPSHPHQRSEHSTMSSVCCPSVHFSTLTPKSQQWCLCMWMLKYLKFSWHYQQQSSDNGTVSMQNKPSFYLGKNSINNRII